LSSLPHGPEFRFLEKIQQLEPGKSGVGEYTVRGDEHFLRGHFPDQAIFPGVLLVEAAAQLAGVIAQCDPGIAPLKNLRLTAMRNVKIFGTAKPGETFRVEAEVIGRFANLIQAKASAHVGETQILQAEITLSGDAP
jgi:3-hydroxyacyl-[acyl-carrier-protein] dehydratase